MPNFQNRSARTVPTFDVQLARNVYGYNLEIMTEAQCLPGMFDETDVTPEVEAALQDRRTDVLSNDEVLRRLKAFGDLAREMPDMAGLVGANAYNTATGSWDDANDDRVFLLDRLQEAALKFDAEVRRVSGDLRRMIQPNSK